MRNLFSVSVGLLAASIPVYAQTYTVLHDFTTDPSGPGFPAAIAQSRGGALFATGGREETQFGAMFNAFRISPNGDLKVLHEFDDPLLSGLILATDGLYYGTTFFGGASGAGSIFKMSQHGIVTTLHQFTQNPDGDYWPWSGPIQSVRGDFIGTTGGNVYTNDGPYGSVYKITKGGVFTVLHAFTGTDGANPVAQLIQGTNYYFYGTTSKGGPYGYGTIFRVSSSGDFKVLANFNGDNGEMPETGLIQANDGNFYGVTQYGGSSGWGVLYRLTPRGTLTVLHNFIPAVDGGYPTALVQGSDGNLYGVTTVVDQSGLNGGVFFRATLAGKVTVLYRFVQTSGIAPQSLIQHTNGKFYGDTYQGGKLGHGVFYSLDVGLQPFVTYLPTYGRAGALVQILGQGFTSASQVSFNGKLAASPVVVYPTYLRVIVPSGATTGPITVTTDNGTLTSNKVFIVHPY